MRRPTTPTIPGSGQESVWDYPRPPRLEPTAKTIRLRLGDEVIGESRRALRVLETSHPPVYYLPMADLRMDLIEPASGSSWCEYKGEAAYWTVRVGDRMLERVGWSYPQPSPGFEALRDHIAFYAAPFDEASVDGEQVRPQPGGFYGGWVTDDVVGPFKGLPGSMGW